MGAAASRGHGATWADIAGRPEEERLEIIEGEIVRKAEPTFEHAIAQGGLTSMLTPPYQWGRGGSGGWWILPEVEIELDSKNVYRPDVTGWRRERVPLIPPERPVRILPDWIAEVLSKSNAEHDLGRKLFGYHRAGVSHYWILDPQNRTLTVHRHTPEGYLVVLVAHSKDKVRAEPFDAIELEIGLLFQGFP